MRAQVLLRAAASLALAAAPVLHTGVAAQQGALPASAGTCTACHGPKGISTVPETPHLAGQPVGYLTAQLKAYREGTRKHEVMNVAAKMLSDTDIDAVARWFSEFKPEVK